MSGKDKVELSSSPWINSPVTEDSITAFAAKPYYGSTRLTILMARALQIKPEALSRRYSTLSLITSSHLERAPSGIISHPVCIGKFPFPFVWYYEQAHMDLKLQRNRRSIDRSCHAVPWPSHRACNIRRDNFNRSWCRRVETDKSFPERLLWFSGLSLSISRKINAG